MTNDFRPFSFLFFAFGIWAIATGTFKAVEGMKAYTWPVAHGRIISAKVKEIKTSQNIKIARLCFYVNYLYEVDGKFLEGNRVNVGWKCFGSEAKIEELSRKYLPGREVAVHYNPSNPSRAVLEPGIDWSIFFLWGLGAASFVFALPLYRQRSSQPVYPLRL